MEKDHIIITWGRFQPPTSGHHAMVQTVKDLADKHGAHHAVFTFQKHGDEKNPLPPDVKEKWMRVILGTDNVFQHEDIKTPGDVFQLLHDKGYKKITVVAGGARAQEYEDQFTKYFGQKTTSKKTGRVLDLTNIHRDNFKVHAIERDADSDQGEVGIESHMIDPRTNKMRLPFVSGSRMREAAVNDSIHAFMSMLPSHVTIEQGKALQKDLKSFGKKNKLQEEVSVKTRIKLSRAARRTAPRRKIVRRMREKRRKNLPQLKKRAVSLIRNALRERVFKGNWKNLPLSSRANIDKQINRNPKLITTMVRKILPKVMKGESERLKNLSKKNLKESMNPVLNNFFSNYISEAKTPRRAPKTGEEKLKRKAQNRNNQRTHRSRESNAIKSGDVKNKVMVVKNNKTGRIEIIDKDSYDKSVHEIKVDAKNATVGAVQKFLNDKAFANTDTSIALFGKVAKGAGGAKEGKTKKSEEPKKKTTSEKPKKETKAIEPVQQMTPATKKASKADTFPTSHNATDMESGIVYAMNSMLGLSPEQMVEKGLIDRKDLEAAMKNSHESFLPSCQRAAQQILKQYGRVYVKHTGRLKKETKLTKEAKDNGVVDTTPKSDLILVDDKGNVVAGLSQKIGESQLSSGGPSETITNLKWAMGQVGDKMLPSSKKQIEQFIKFFETELSGNPRTKSGPVSLYQTGGQRGGEDKEVARREKLHDKATEMLNSVLNGDKKLASAFVFALMTGASKFEEGSAAIATHIFSANRDGTNSKLTPITTDYCEKILDKVKFQMKFKSSAAETTDVRKKWEEFKERKRKLGEKVTLEEDFRPYSYRSVIRAYLTENFLLTGNKLIKVLIEKSEKIEDMVQEPKTPEEAVQYLKDAFEYIGDDGFKLMQFFEDTIDFGITEPVINWPEYANQTSSITNKVYVNGKEFVIPVEEPYNYDESGRMNSALSEGRNYRKEYDNYHSKPEQRKNRSKRVLARRLMMKLGRVKKGDGKDVDHKDGNPRNNGKHNLRVRSKSENRADND